MVRVLSKRRKKRERNPSSYFFCQFPGLETWRLHAVEKVHSYSNSFCNFISVLLRCCYLSWLPLQPVCDQEKTLGASHMQAC